MYTLYGSRSSGSAAVEIALDVAGVPWRLVRASSWEPDSAIEELRAINPLGQVPTMVLPDGTVMSESAAILLHLGLEFPASGLLPADASRRARSLRGLVYVAANCYAAIGVIDYPERWYAEPDDATSERIRRGTRSRLHQSWDLFADLFAADPYLEGPEPGALDFLAAVVSRWSGTRQHLATSRPGFLATLQRIEAHPAAAPVFARHWPPTTS